MNKLKTFFSALIKSSTQPTYGNDVMRANGGFSIQYFLFFTFLTALVTTAVMSVPLAAFPVEKLAYEVAGIYPPDLQVHVDPTTGLSINQPLPYTIYANDMSEDGQLERLALVTFASESAELTFDKIATFEAAMVVTEHNIYARREDEGRFEVTPIPEVTEPFTFTRGMIDEKVSMVLNSPIVKNKWYVPALAIVILGLSFPLMLIGRGLTAVFYALITWILASTFMKDKKVSFGKMIQLSVHTLTPIVIAAYIIDFAGYTFFHGWWYFLAYAVWTLVMVSQLKASGVNAAPVVTTPQPVATSPKKKTAIRKRTTKSKK